MVLDSLSSSLKNTLKKVAGSIFVNEKVIDDIIKDIQRALLQADVNVSLVFELSKKIKERALNEKLPAAVSKREHIIKIVYEELVSLLGSEKSELVIQKKKPFKIMLIGIYGSGKSTSIGKIAKFYSNRGYKIASLGLDIYRPAAMDQLEQISKKAGIKCFTDKSQKDPLKIYKEFEKEYKNFDILLIDTAGRDAVSQELIKELKKLNEEIKPDERLLVLSGDIGQAAMNQAKTFHDAVNITGVIITKLDGTAKGGGALTGASATFSHIKFIGTGEKIDDLETFNPKGFVSRLLGMGDLEALLEKAKTSISEEQAKDMTKKLSEGDFNFLDLYEQMESMKKMGPLSKIVEMIPGFSQIKLPKEMLEVQDEKLQKWKFILQSMTKEELENPESLTKARIERVAKGSGINESDVRELFKQYKQSKKLIKAMKGDPEKLMKKFKGKIPGM